MLRPSNISTNYYKIAHLHDISYRIYTAVDSANEQMLLELEVQIRHDHPSILINYYNRSLFVFQFSHVASSIDLQELYPQLKLLLSHTSSPKDLTTSRTVRPAADDPVPYAGLCFLKAVKKLVLFNLSRAGAVKLFGNYAVAADDEKTYSIIYLDPILLPSGDVLVSMSRRTKPRLLATSVLETSSSAYYAIYLIPSGIRCHLFGANLEACLTSVPPSNHKPLISLLERAIGVSISLDILWVKLVPNLQHLNNQTSPISQFVHSVDNKKYIMWPWNLCLVQYGHTEHLEEPLKNSPFDPVGMISEFLDFSINVHLQMAPLPHDSQLAPPFSVPSIMSTDASGEVVEVRDSVEDEVFPSPLVGLPKENERSEKLDDELDDLFGDNSEPENDDKQQIKDISVKDTTTENGDVEMHLPSPKTEHISSPLVAATSIQNLQILQNKLPNQLSQSQQSHQTFVDIPKDQMLTKEQMLASFRATPQSYDDPGAPPAIMPTPVVPQHYQSTPGDTIPSKSVFSPILFNPLIKNNIDTKYGKGGKFYVEKDSSVGVEDAKSKTRATSVLAPTNKDGVTGLGISRHRQLKDYEEVFADDESMDSEKSASSDESDEDEADDNAIMESVTLPLRLNVADMSADNVKSAPNNPSNGENFNGTHGPDGQSSSLPTSSVPISLSVAGAGLAFNTGLANVDSFYLPFMKNTKKDWPESVQLEEVLNPLEASEPASTNASEPALRNLEPESDHTEEKKQDSQPPSSSSTNCLPLILRGINTSTIPDMFLTNNIENNIKNELIMDVEADTETSDLGCGMELKAKSEGLNDLLETLVPSLIFDHGLTNIDSKLVQYFVNDEEEALVHLDRIPLHLSTAFLSLFPHSYNVSLFEFLTPIYGQDEKTSFLDELTVTGMLQFEGEKLNNLQWDAIYPDAGNQESSDIETYLQLVSQIEESPEREDSGIIALKEPMITVKKDDAIINLSSTSLSFWNFLNFSPVNGPKDFQTVLVCDSDPNNTGSQFLDSLAYCYHECSFGTMAKLNLNSLLSLDLQRINGTINIVYDETLENGGAVRVVERELMKLAELIKLDLMEKSNSFDFKSPFLLLFALSDTRFNAHLLVAKLLRNFRQVLRQNQLPIVEVFCHIIPSSVLFKGPPSSRSLRYLSSSKLCRIAMSLYNQCPTLKHNSATRPLNKTAFATLAKDPPEKLRLNLPGATKDSKDAYSDDIFLHLAYERSIDKSWIVGVWSDPRGLLTHTKAWYCSPSRRTTKVANSIEEVCDDLWALSMEFFKNLIEQASKNVSGRKFLVLTRVNNVIPDDELVHWKRLSVKHKEISLIVLSVNKSPKTVFSSSSNGEDETMEKTENVPTTMPPDIPLVDSDVFRLGYGNSNSTSPAAMMGSSPNNINFLSPRQILNALGNFLSPQDLISTVGSLGGHNGVNGGASPSKVAEVVDTERILEDPSQDICAVVPITTLPTVNSPTRLAMKSGYLLGSFGPQMLQYEVSLLSCSSYWSPDAIMKILLRHYKKMIVLGDILCIKGKFQPPQLSESRFTDEQAASAIVPWHITAVTKALDYLVHVEVN